MQIKSKRIQKLITFSPQLYHLTNIKAEEIGLSFPDYLRHLLAIALEKETAYILLVNEETEKRIGKSLEALEKGKYIEIKDDQALSKALGIK